MCLMHLQAPLLAKWITVHCPVRVRGANGNCIAVSDPAGDNGVTRAQGKQLSAEVTSPRCTRSRQNGLRKCLE